MPTPLLSLATSEISLRWRETYASGGINSKQAAIIPAGIYRGFRIGTFAALVLNIDPATDFGNTDNVAVYQQSSAGVNFALTLRKATSFTVNFAPVAAAPGVYVLGLVGDWTAGIDSTAVLQIYILADYDALAVNLKREFIVLGTVTIAGGAITAAVEDRRTMAWERTAPEGTTWSPLVRNGGFDWADNNATYSQAAAYWEGTNAGLNAEWKVSTTEPAPSPSTSVKAMELRRTAAGPVTETLAQSLGVPVKVGRRIKAVVNLRVIEQATAGSLEFFAEFQNAAGAVSTTVLGPLVDTTTVAGAYKALERYLIVPAASPHLRRIGFKAIGINWTPATVAIRLDDVQFFLEGTAREAAQVLQDEQTETLIAHEVMFADPLVPFSAQSPKLTYVDASRTLTGARRDDLGTTNPQPILDWLGSLRLGSNLLGTLAEALTPRILANGSVASTYTLMWECQVGAGATKLRIYSGGIPAFTVTLNALWGGATWSQDDAGVGSAALYLAETKSEFRHQFSGSGPWADGSWEKPFISNFNTLLTTLSGILTLGGSYVSTDTLATQARVSSKYAPLATTAYTLLWSSAPDVGALNTLRIYSTATGDFVATVNARWGSTGAPTAASWNKDQAGNGAIKFAVLGSGTGAVTMSQRFPASGAVWNDAAWDSIPYALLQGTLGQAALGLRDSSVAFTNNTTGVLGGNPPSTSLFTNQLKAKNIVKAWGSLKTDGATPYTIEVRNGFNVASATKLDGTTILVTLASAMADAKYAVHVDYHGSGADEGTTVPVAYLPVAWGRTVTTFKITLVVPTTGVAVTLEAKGPGDLDYLSFSVVGEQT